MNAVAKKLEAKEAHCPHIKDIDPNSIKKHDKDSDITRIMRTCCLIEALGEDYSDFLEEIFSSDAELRSKISEWGVEETYHGITLNWYLRHAFDDQTQRRSFDGFNKEIALYPQGHKLFRKNKTAELISRCSVESATSTLYFSIVDKSSDPVIKKICERLARDEVKHYSLFLKNARIMNLQDQTSKVKRFTYVVR